MIEGNDDRLAEIADRLRVWAAAATGLLRPTESSPERWITTGN